MFLMAPESLVSTTHVIAMKKHLRLCLWLCDDDDDDYNYDGGTSWRKKIFNSLLNACSIVTARFVCLSSKMTTTFFFSKRRFFFSNRIASD